uniref:Apoptosis antagonizing transcription factor/protein transport protein n=1 Tax=Stomoxys calcitrans TaxID=35570 RepID=A0A1I8Q3I7_STOCA|nr:unnamed protein product [Stomoxys calcitrans]XP_013102829.1 unnamed protein product [Stomoxys calcitrans]
MLKKPKNKQKTVAETVAALLTHRNESGSEDSDSEKEATAPKVVEFDENEYQMPEARTTEFRKRNVKLLSEQSSKYKGKISSRKELEEDDEQEESDDDDDDVDGLEYEESDESEGDGDNEIAEDSSESENEKALKSFGSALRKQQVNNKQVGDSDESEDHFDEEDAEEGTESEDGGEDDDDDVEDDDDEDDDEYDNEEDEDDANEESEVISKVNRDAEIQKGLCVQNQLQLWERLLEMRIKSQKILSQANQLPAADEIKQLVSSNDEHKTTTQEAVKQTQKLLQSLLQLQDTLYSQYSELNKSIKPSLKRPSPFKQQHPNSEEPPLKQINGYLQDRFDTFRSYRNSVLIKWDDRTKLLQPGAGAKKRTLEEYDIIKKIDNTLMNKATLIQKSQQMKNSQRPKTEEDTENKLQTGEDDLNVNVYDDSDFYHQQLRELIEYKANTSNNMSEVTKQYLELQKLRQKMKKKVDTRASKGRKLRYVVHNKLINFMAPHDNSSWTNDSKDELCKSLFV